MTEVKEQSRRSVAAATIGTSLEWYDYFLYGSMAVIVFPTVFFPVDDPLMSTLVSVASFGVAFIVRPIGAFLFGRLGDRLGRRDVLMYTLIMMGVATLAIGLMPSYEQVGLWAPVVVIVARLLQGLSTGGEWGSAVLMSVEQSPDERTLGKSNKSKAGFLGSFVQSASPIGLLLSNTAILGVGLLGSEAMMEWAWRIPFLFGGLIAVVGIFIRLKVRESEFFETLRDEGSLSSTPIASAFRNDLGSMTLVALSYMGVGTIFYVAVIFGQSYGLSVDFTQPEISLIIVIFSLALIAATIVVGAQTDRIGLKRAMLIGLIGCTIFAPFWTMMFSSGSLGLGLVAYVVLAAVFAYCWAPMAAFYSQAMSASSRNSSLSIGYQVGSVLGGAIPPIIAVWLYGVTASIWAVMVYVGITLIISIFATIRLGQRRTTIDAKVTDGNIVGATAKS